MIWYIWGNDKEECPKIEIEANSFDEAIKVAREINPNYNAGQVKERR